MRSMLRIVAILVAGIPACLAGPGPARAAESLFGTDSASVTYGPYARIELGLSSPNPGGSYWLPPNYPSDPRIDFLADVDSSAFGAVAFGFDWMNGFRGEFALTGFGSSDVVAPCGSASDGSPCSGHADITQASVKTRALMFNAYYAPLEARGQNRRLQPFLLAGIGAASNEVTDWTRTNPGASTPVRTFEGARDTDFAWSIGAGVAYEIDRGGNRWPILVEATYRYFDLGTAAGGSTPLPGNGSSSPVEPFQFENRSHVVSIGMRIPLQHY